MAKAHEGCVLHTAVHAPGSSDTGAAEEGDAVARLQLDMPRRSRQVTFTCNKCGEGPCSCLPNCTLGRRHY